MKTLKTSTFYLVIIGLLCLGIFGGYITYQYITLRDYSFSLEDKLLLTETTLTTTEKTLGRVELEKEELSEALDEQYNKVNSLEQQVQTMTNAVQNMTQTVGMLEKLSRTDPELLKKYSKVYFLNEHYVPPRLTQIETKYGYDKKKEYLIHASVWPYLKEMLEAAKLDEIELGIISSFRSFDTQATLKAGYTFVYGTGANTFSADQGYSEHQLGTAVDFTTLALGASYTSFDKTEAYTWLKENAHLYGFVISYPKGNAYYQFEPWHWRFVGTKLATYLYKKSLNFYDMNQREIDGYLVSIFD